VKAIDTPPEASDLQPAAVGDIWAALRAATSARVGLTRVGHSLSTSDVLDLRQAHARARDAVHTPFDVTALLHELADLQPLRLHSAAKDRLTYLRRPDLGRRLAHGSLLPQTGSDVVFVLADGLSVAATMVHAPAVLRATIDALPGWSIGPVVIAEQARVALGDDVADATGAAAVVVLIGERPGLTATDSLGAYITHGPRADSTDAERNCVSNIRPPDGLSHHEAASQISRLLVRARALGRSGVSLKNDEDPALGAPPAAAAPPLAGRPR
jgi:ethanolamine ammonia-lyase small subunit